MSEKFSSFASFGATFKKEAAKEHQEQTREILEKIKNNLASVPEGPLKSGLPEIEYISFVHPKGHEDGQSLNAIVFSKNKYGKLVNHTWSINRNGRITPIDNVPQEMESKIEEISFEIVSLIEKIRPSAIHLTEAEFIPDSDEGGRISNAESSSPREEVEDRPIDPEREAFLASLKDALFISMNKQKGLSKYQLVAFSDYFYLENLMIGNAAYFVELPERIDMEKIRNQLKEEGATEEGFADISDSDVREEVIRKYWKPIGEKAKTRKELIALGAKKVVHTPGTWQEKILKEIEIRKN